MEDKCGNICKIPCITADRRLHKRSTAPHPNAIASVRAVCMSASTTYNYDLMRNRRGPTSKNIHPHTLINASIIVMVSKTMCFFVINASFSCIEKPITLGPGHSTTSFLVILTIFQRYWSDRKIIQSICNDIKYRRLSRLKERK